MPTTWRRGLYLGVCGKSGEIIAAGEKGVGKTRTTQRKPQDQRWDAKSADLATHHPWRMEDDLSRDNEPVAVAVRMKDREVEGEKNADPEAGRAE